jgi:hypothetical protein
MKFQLSSISRKSFFSEHRKTSVWSSIIWNFFYSAPLKAVRPSAISQKLSSEPHEFPTVLVGNPLLNRVKL